ncbi:MAG: hypothetical protein RBT67_09175 [Thauera sp.]|jgi:hypothetical protein|nr:hypothetical protein [Thauera sp.]
MNTKLIPLSLAIAAALLTQTPAVHAASLGEIQGTSALGEAFRAEIALIGAGTEVGCFRVASVRAEEDGIPAIGSGQITIEGRGTQARLVIRSSARVHDPIVRIAVENICESRLHKEFTLLLPFTSAADTAAPQPRPQARPRPASRPGAGAPPATTPKKPATAPAKGEPPARTASKGRPAGGESASDRLVVDKAEPPVGANTRGERAPAEPSADLLTRERELAAAIDRSIIAEMELLARIKELEEIQARLEARLRAAVASAPAAAPAIPSIPAASAPVTAAPAAQAPTATDTIQNDVYLFAGLGAVALLLALWLRGRRNEPPPVAKRPTDEDARETVRRGVARAEDTLFASPTTVSTSTVTRPPTPAEARAEAFSLAPPPEVVDTESMEEHKSAVELAEIMMSFGRVRGAADTLAEFIRSNPREAVTPWLKLLEAYRAGGLREEFDAVARELNKTFNVNTVTWDNYDTLRSISASLEDLSHVSENLQHSWGTTVCQRYLQHLLRDNRDGTRAGFPFPVVDEILTLAAILDDQLGPYKSVMEQVAPPASTLPR